MLHWLAPVVHDEISAELVKAHLQNDTGLVEWDVKPFSVNDKELQQISPCIIEGCSKPV